MVEVLGWKPWKKQSEIGEALVRDQRVSVVSCNGAGKTTCAARLLLWFVQTRRNAVVVTTAPTWHQVGLLWREVRTAFSASKRPLEGELMSQRLELAANWYATGLSTDREERFQGYHAGGSQPGDDGGLLVIVDEASGVSDPIYDAMRGYLTSPNSYVLLIGNGNRAQGAFHESHQRGRWRRFEISAYDVPEHIMDRSWIDEQREHWGEESAQYIVRVLGKFPEQGGDYQLIPQWLLESTCSKTPEGAEGVHMGLDVARGGGDQSVAVVTVDGVVQAVESWDSPDLMVTAERSMALAKRLDVPSGHIHVDVSGIGAGVVDRLREAGLGVEGVDFGGKAEHDYDWLLGTDSKFLNRKAELHWAGRMLLMNSHASVPRKYSRTLWRQLGWTNYEYNARGMMRMESKDKLRARFGASPDHADAWVLSLSRATQRRRIFVV
jgi:phage terminase large subunit